MSKREFGWRWVGVAALVATAIPALWAMRPAPVKQMPVNAGEVWEVPGEIVVDVRDSAGPSDIASLARAYSVSFAGFDTFANSGRILTVKTNPSLAAGLLARLRRDPNVEHAEPQRLFKAFWTPNDPRLKEQWNFKRINMEKAWDVSQGKGAVVAVIDTGVAFEKDDKCYWARDFKDTKFTKPYDFIFKDKHPNDDHGHGTHVSGTIAESTDNGEGVAGIAFKAQIMPLKVLTKEGYGKMSDIAAAIRYAADKGAHVINMSLGGPFPDSVSRSACQYAFKKGVTIVCAAGNSGQEGVGYPAAYPECIAVSALGPTGKLSYYSSWGKQVAISAPGGDKQHGEDKGILQNTVLRKSGSAGDAHIVWIPAGINLPEVWVGGGLSSEDLRNAAGLISLDRDPRSSFDPEAAYAMIVGERPALDQIRTRVALEFELAPANVVIRDHDILVMGKRRGLLNPSKYWRSSSTATGLESTWLSRIWSGTDSKQSELPSEQNYDEYYDKDGHIRTGTQSDYLQERATAASFQGRFEDLNEVPFKMPGISQNAFFGKPGDWSEHADSQGRVQSEAEAHSSVSAGFNSPDRFTNRFLLDKSEVQDGDDYYHFQGTSMASPHVAGVAALIVSQGVKDPAEVKAILQKSAQKRGPKEKYGAGELDAYAAAKLAGSTSQVYWERLALVGGIWAAGIGLGLIRRRGSGPSPIAAAIALTVGMYLPDTITYLAGFDSAWNLIGHSVLIPAYLVVWEAESLRERRFLAVLALALTAHLGWDLVRGTAPAMEASLPWLWTNVVVGFGAFLSGLRRA